MSGVPAEMSEPRIAVPNRRNSEVIGFSHDGLAYQGQVSWLADGRPIEIFLDAGKAGTALQAIARDSAVAVSLALQHGASLAVLRGAMTRGDGDLAAGPLGRMLDLVEGT